MLPNNGGGEIETQDFQGCWLAARSSTWMRRQWAFRHGNSLSLPGAVNSGRGERGLRGAWPQRVSNHQPWKAPCPRVHRPCQAVGISGVPRAPCQIVRISTSFRCSETPVKYSVIAQTISRMPRRRREDTLVPMNGMSSTSRHDRQCRRQCARLQLDHPEKCKHDLP